jgi:hypothetical protein
MLFDSDPEKALKYFLKRAEEPDVKFVVVSDTHIAPPPIVERNPFYFDLSSKHFDLGQDPMEMPDHDGDAMVIPPRLGKKAQYKHEGKYYVNKGKKK